MISVYQYTNYREFLRDYYAHRKATEGFTHRDFAKLAGMNSTAWLLHLIRGTKNLSSDSVQRVTKAISLGKHEAEFFEILVAFTQARTSSAKDLFYQKMLAQKHKLGIAHLIEQQYEYYSRWWHPIIRSLVSKVEWGDDYGLLANALLPPISPNEAKLSVKLLMKLGLIRRDENGNWEQVYALISTGNEVDSLQVVNYHRQVSRLAEEVHDRTRSELRDISALTLGINEAVAKAIKERIQSFRKELIDLARACENADRVYQLNFQFFPVSKPSKKVE